MAQHIPQRSSGRLALGLVLGLALGVPAGIFAPRLWQTEGGVGNGIGVEDKQAEAEIRLLYDREHELLLRRDFAAQERFYPDDFVVTNPFNMFIDKPKVMERLRADIIKYSTYERGYDYFRRYGETAVMVGSETVVPTPDANRPDAGKTVHRRFTEVWVRRDGGWQKVVRHASNISEPVQTPGDEKPAKQAVQAFYDTYNSHDWPRATEFTTEDWTHIDPGGGWTRGREAVLKLLKEAHATFLKGVTDTPDEMEVRFATADVAVVTVPSTMKGTFTTPDGKKHENDLQIRTFVVVRRGGKWLIMQDQNTIRGG